VRRGGSDVGTFWWLLRPRTNERVGGWVGGWASVVGCGFGVRAHHVDELDVVDHAVVVGLDL
jgi:hypothetical protein